MAIRKIAFCETITQVDRLLADHQDSIDTYLAITPEAASRLRQKGIAYRKPEDFYDEALLYAHGRALAELADEWVNWSDEYLQQSVPEFKRLNFRPARYHYYFLKVLMDELFMRSYILDHILQNLKPAEVVYFGQDRPLSIGSDLFFYESVYSLIVPKFCQRLGISTTRLDGGAGEPTNTSQSIRKSKGWRAGLLSTARLLLPENLRTYVRLLGQCKWKAVALGLQSWDKRQLRIVLQPHYDVELLWQQASRAGIGCRLLAGLRGEIKTVERQSDDIKDQMRRIWHLVGHEESFRQPFKYADLDLTCVVESRLRLWWEHTIPEMWLAFLAARRTFSGDSPKAMVVPMAMAYGPRAVAALYGARSLGIPVIIYQHGGFVASCETGMHDFGDLLDADYLFVYGQGTADYFSARIGRYQEPRAVPIPVGSARLDAVRRKGNGAGTQVLRRRIGGEKDKPLVLYVPTLFFGYTRYLCGTYPDVSYFELQCELLKVFQDFPRMSFVYKEFVDCFRNPVPDIARDTVSNVRVVRDIPLTDLIWAVDAIIVDFPSTGLLEALLTDKPIMCFADFRNSRLTSRAKELLSRRAVVTETSEEFLHEVRRFLAAGDFAAEASPNRDFLKAYGTYVDDGRSAERAVEVLEEIIRVHPSSKQLAPA